MTFHQAIVEAFHAAGRPLAAGIELGPWTGILVNADSPEAFSADDGLSDLADLRVRLDNAVGALWQSLGEGSVSADDLEVLIDFADRRAASLRDRHAALRDAIARASRQLSGGTDAATRASDRRLDQERKVERMLAEATNLLVRFYYELLALRAEIRNEPRSRAHTDIDSLLADLNS